MFRRPPRGSPAAVVPHHGVTGSANFHPRFADSV